MPTLAVIAIVVVVVLAAALALYVFTRPDRFRVERSAAVAAPPSVVFDIVNALVRWPEWSPYDKRDPAMKKSYDGPSAGPGSSYAWNGNGQVGQGRLTITDAVPAERVTMRLEFTRPFKCDNVVNFHFVPAADGSRVTWAMEGKCNTVSKLMGLFIDMDKMVGKDFEQGLANLDTVARGTATPVAAPVG